MMNAHELNSQSHILLAQRRAEAETHRLAKIAMERANRQDRQVGQRGVFSKQLQGLLARLQVERTAH